MFKPTSDFMIVEEYKEVSRIALPDSVKDESKTFIIKDVGPGHYENGILIKPQVKIGDRVAIVGKLVRIPCRDNGSVEGIIIGRAGDVIAYERQEQEEKIYA